MSMASSTRFATTKSLVLGVVGLVILPIAFSTSALYFARVGMKNRERGARFGLLLSVLGIVIGAIVFVKTVQFQLQ
jgi:hypothetical protein